LVLKVGKSILASASPFFMASVNPFRLFRSLSPNNRVGRDTPPKLPPDEYTKRYSAK